MVTDIINIIVNIPWHIWVLAALALFLGYLAYKELRGIPKRTYDARINDIIEGELIGDSYVTMREYWAEIDRGPGGKWIGLAFSLSPSEATEATGGSIERLLGEEKGRKGDLAHLIRKFSDTGAFQYLITGDGDLTHGSIGGLRLDTLYLFIKVNNFNEYDISIKLKNLLRGLVSMGIPVKLTPVPAYIHSFVRRDPFGRPYSPPLIVRTEEETEGLAPRFWMDLVTEITKGEIPREEALMHKQIEELIKPPPPLLKYPEVERAPLDEIVAYGTVRPELTQKMTAPALIGYQIGTGIPVHLDYMQRGAAHMAIIGPTRKGKSYAAGVIAEKAAYDANARVFIICPQGLHSSYGVPNDYGIGAKETNELKIVQKFIQDYPQWSERPISIPIKVLLVGKDDKKQPYDELFKINTPELTKHAFIDIISEFAGKIGPIQVAMVDMIREYLTDNNIKYSLKDFADVARDFMTRPEDPKYAKYVLKYGRTPKEMPQRLGPIVTRLVSILNRLPDTFVAEGGTDFKDPNISRRGMITSIVFSKDIIEDNTLFSAIVDYIIVSISKAYGWESPEDKQLIKDAAGGGVHVLVMFEEAASYLREGMSATVDAIKLAQQGAKYGIQALYIYQTLGKIPKELTGNITLLRIVFVPEAEIEEDFLKMITTRSEQRERIRRAFAHLISSKETVGKVIVSGQGTDADPWALVHIVPKRTRSTPFTSQEEWKAWRAKQREKEERRKKALAEEAPEEAVESRYEDIIEDLKKRLEK